MDAEQEPRKPVFTLRRAAFEGEGLQDSDASWERLRDLSYEGRGA